MRLAEQVLAVAVVVLVTGCVLPASRRAVPGPAALIWAAATLAAVGVWFLHKAPYEGPAIITVTSTRGLTVVDMIVLPGLALPGAVASRAWAARRERDSR